MIERDQFGQMARPTKLHDALVLILEEVGDTYSENDDSYAKFAADILDLLGHDGQDCLLTKEAYHA